MNRNLFLRRLDEVSLWDIIVIGGGASGLGIALDASSRGYSVLLLEQSDFAKGTSSRSTKLIHGGVRYLAQGNIRLVYEALRERGFLLRNAPHLVRKQSFIIPCFNWFQKIKYLLGLKLYGWMAGKFSLGKSVLLNRNQVIDHLPNIVTSSLIGGIQYYDAQFDDARLAISLAQTASEHGAVVLNYCNVTSLIKKESKSCGVTVIDVLNNKNYTLNAKAIINATGVFVDTILELDKQKQNSLVRPSQGVHLVIDGSFLKSNDAILIPKTPDNRILFVVPWHGQVLLGTTDTPVDKTSIEPIALKEEIDFILNTAKEYLLKAPRREDVLSIFAGLRPLTASGKKATTREISRTHKILVSESGLITVIGGKWTTYRKMAEDGVDKAVAIAGLKKMDCQTKEIRIHGYIKGMNDTSSVFGSDEEKINELIQQDLSLNELLDPQFHYKKAHVIWAVRHEMAMTVEDVLARRLRILFLNAQSAMKMAPFVAVLIAKELNHDQQWIDFQVTEFKRLANQYLINSR